MKINRLYLFVLAILLTLSVGSNVICAQRGDTGPAVFTKISEESSLKNAMSVRVKEKKKDIIEHKPELYQNIVRRNGWFVGVGKLTVEEAKKMNHFFRLSQMNSAGNWTFVEAISGDGNYTTDHDFHPYLLPRGRAGKNQESVYEWKKKLEAICKWDFSYDETGKTVIVERAYDKDDNLIISSTPVILDDGSVMTSYLDEWGRPLKLTTGNKAFMTQSFRNKDGLDVRVQLLDNKGNMIENGEGGNIICYKYDSKLRLIEEEFFSVTMNRMRNRGGSVGYSYSFPSDSIMIRKQLSSNSKPYKTVYKYKDRNLSSVNYYNFDDSPWEGIDQSHTTHYTYHKDGSPHETIHLDTAGNYMNVSDKFAGESFKIRQWKEGGFPQRATYRIVNDSIVCNYYLKSAKERDEWTYSGPNYNYTEIGEKDADGRYVSDAFYRDGKPWTPSNKNFHKKVYPVKQLPNHKAITEEKYLDGNGEVIFNSAFTSTTTIIDSVGNTKTIVKRNRDGDVLSNSREHYPRGFSNVTDIDVQYLNALGNPTYINSNGRIGYAFRAGRDIYNRLNLNIAINPLGEPAYFNTMEEAYYACVKIGGKWLYFDEDRDQTVASDLFKKLPKTNVVEITDSIGYGHGLKDGDYIIGFGNWVAPDDSIAADWNSLMEETILQTPEKKTMLVVRTDRDTKEASVKELTLPEGDIAELGFTFHPLCLTRRENTRRRDAIQQYLERKNFASLREVRPAYASNAEDSSYNMSILVPKTYTNGGYVDSDPVISRAPRFVLYYDKSNTDGNGKKSGRIWHMEEELRFDRFPNIALDTVYKNSFLVVADGRTQLDSIICKNGRFPFYQASVVVSKSDYDKYAAMHDEWADTTSHGRVNEATRQVLVCNVVAEDGYYMFDNGYRGRFLTLQYGDWDCRKNADSFNADNYRDVVKPVILLPIDTVSFDIIGEPIEQELPEGIVGLRFQQTEFSPYDFKNKVLSEYNKVLLKRKIKKNEIQGSWKGLKIIESDSLNIIKTVIFDLDNSGRALLSVAFYFADINRELSDEEHLQCLQIEIPCSYSIDEDLSIHPVKSGKMRNKLKKSVFAKVFSSDERELIEARLQPRYYAKELEAFISDDSDSTAKVDNKAMARRYFDDMKKLHGNPDIFSKISFTADGDIDFRGEMILDYYDLP